MSDLGNLSQCIVDADPEVRARARRLRQKALVASLSVEAVFLGAMLMWPLITPGVLPTGYVVTPVPPYPGGGSRATHPNTTHHSGSHRPSIPIRNQFIFQPPNASVHHQQTDSDAAPVIGDNIVPGEGSDPVGDGPVVPGGNGSGYVVQPPRPPESSHPVRKSVSEGVMEGALIRRVEPVYPMIARQMHLSGIVRLRAVIATDGSVQDLEVLSGSPILSRAAQDAVRRWRYRPTLLNGAPVEVETYITVTFILGGQ